jgi:hypothetical protein
MNENRMNDKSKNQDRSMSVELVYVRSRFQFLAMFAAITIFLCGSHFS